ncbi:hypothetical protein L596_026926 [Steinernema carpocapsae]|uniref:Uncharacterized protein n=1 Tax=Steinernema carpocapsae TaxID=34508 RepID=A0A4U5M3Q8_STECR|nr:hypothetical protein L596_026926 [Steinernema carpocapsae]
MDSVPIDFVDSVIQSNSRKDLNLSSWKQLSGIVGDRAHHLADNQIFVVLCPLDNWKFKVSGYLNAEVIKEMSIEKALKMEKFLVQLKINDSNKADAGNDSLFKKALRISCLFPDLQLCHAHLRCKTLQEANVFLTKLSFNRFWHANWTEDRLNFLLFQLKSGRLEEVHELDANILATAKRIDIFQAFFESKTCKSMFFRNGVQLSSYLPLIFELWTNMDEVNATKTLETEHGFFSIDQRNPDLANYRLRYQIDPKDNELLRVKRAALFCTCPFTITDPNKPGAILSWSSRLTLTFGCNYRHCLKCRSIEPCQSATRKIRESSYETKQVVFSR